MHVCWKGPLWSLLNPLPIPVLTSSGDNVICPYQNHIPSRHLVKLMYKVVQSSWYIKSTSTLVYLVGTHGLSNKSKTMFSRLQTISSYLIQEYLMQAVLGRWVDAIGHGVWQFQLWSQFLSFFREKMRTAKPTYWGSHDKLANPYNTQTQYTRCSVGSTDSHNG